MMVVLSDDSNYAENGISGDAEYHENDLSWTVF